MPEESLFKKTKRGLVWSSALNFGVQGISFLCTLVLARLLTPSEYGILAMPAIFLSLAQVFINSGFSAALIRKPDLTEEDLSTAFYFNIVVGVVCYIALFCASPLIADFYNTPILSKILKVTALATLFNPLCIVQQALLSRKIDFKTQTYISVSAALIGGVVGISMAYNGYGVWSLVFQNVSSSIIRVILLWVRSDWRPHTGWSRASFSYLWGFGSKMVGVSIIDVLYHNIYTVVIGKFYSAKDLGNYSRAGHFASFPSVSFTGILQRVTFPVLSTIQDDDERLARNYRKILRLSAYCVFPLMTGLAAVARPMVLVVLGEKWLGCVIFLVLICFTRMWYPIHAINLNLLSVKGRSDLFFRLEIIKKFLGVCVMAVTIPMGLVYMVGGGIVSSLLALLVNTYYTGKMIKCGFVVQMKDIAPSFFLSLSMIVIIRLSFLFFDNPYIQIAVGVALGVSYYYLCSRLFNVVEWSYLKEMFFKRK